MLGGADTADRATRSVQLEVPTGPARQLGARHSMIEGCGAMSGPARSESCAQSALVRLPCADPLIGEVSVSRQDVDAGVGEACASGTRDHDVVVEEIDCDGAGIARSNAAGVSSNGDGFSALDAGVGG